MKRKTNPHDQAFPEIDTFGMSKREYFASLAMPAIIQECMVKTQEKNMHMIASSAVEFADSLIEALNRDAS